MTDDFDELFKKIFDALGQSQAINLAHSYILMEIVCDVARSRPDPRKYLANIFERISARADEGPIEKEAHPVTAEFRDTIARFFSLAGDRLQAERGGRP